MVWGDYLSFEYGKPVKDKQSIDGNVPVFGTNGQIGTSHLPPLCKIPSFVVGRKGAYRGVHYSSVPFSVIDTAFYALPLTDKVDLKWAYYKFLTYDINRMDSGSAIPSTDRYELYKIEVEIPSLETQKKIVSVLDVFENIIRVNSEINENLAQQAQAIYADIFITNADPAWPLGHLSDLITVRYGKDHKKLADGPFPVYGSGGVMRYVERPIYEKESVLIPRKGTLNNVMYVNEPFWSVDTMFFTEMKLPDVAKFVFHFVKSKDLASLNAGSAVPSMTTDILNAMELCIPDPETLKCFESIVGPMYRAMQHNTEESKKLAIVRDTLIPRLMSGEFINSHQRREYYQRNCR